MSKLQEAALRMQIMMLKDFQKKQHRGFIRYCIMDGAVYTILFIIWRIIDAWISIGWSNIDWKLIGKNILLEDIVLGIVILGPLTWFMNKRALKKYQNLK